MERIAQPLDFLGVNYYTCKLFHDPAGSCGAAVINRRNPQHMMSRGWEIYPQALADLLLWIHRAFAFPALYVTENGAMYDDVVYEGEVHDPARIAYIKAHVSVMPDLIGQGVPLKGYFCWNLMDNFEWASGTGDKFGLAHTNFETQERFLKDSGKWFARITRANAVVD